jgi:hypothetical protein
MEFDIEPGYKIEAYIELACRKEKWVWGDSAQYETFTQDPKSLIVKVENKGNLETITLINSSVMYYEYDRFFSSGEECRASFKVLFISQKYAMGYGYNPSKPVTFKLWKGFYDYQRGDQFYDLNKMRKYLDNTTYSFVEKRYQNSHINIWIKQDDREASTSPWVEKAYINPTTGKPDAPKSN